jgi:hypothetical protein
MKKNLHYLLLFAFISLIAVTCKKETVPTTTKKIEVCDFGELNKNILQTREEFEMAKGGGGSTGGLKPRDFDKDGIPDINDNCPRTRNVDQKDTDGDGIGDVCDPYPYGNDPIVSSVILLDFDGYNLPSGTSWYNGQPYTCQPSGLYPAEIQTILDSVKKDFFKYNVLVTTDENVYLRASIAKRMRVVITTSSEIYPNVAGVAYVGSMFWSSSDNQCFVFSNLLSYNALRIRIATSHESGHTVGLYHQSQWDANCNLIFTYKPCDVNGTGPIMGSVGSSCVPLWWIGPTPNGCTNIQDDNQIITQNIGLK